jgi:hypothetical protein
MNIGKPISWGASAPLPTSTSGPRRERVAASVVVCAYAGLGGLAKGDVSFPPVNDRRTAKNPVMTSATSTFEIASIPAEVLSLVRSARTDASGNPVVEVAATGGEPLRCCLRDARRGETLLLFGFEPPLPPSPYREVGAVFAHAAPCGGSLDSGSYPSEWRRRPQVLRAYDQRGWICEARVHDGTDPETTINEMFENETVAEIHSRNVAYGCYMFLIRRV